MNPIIILSFDGLSAQDLEYLREFPGFNRFLSEASGSSQVDSIYPSVTYAAHASIITGCYPMRHGVIDNTKVQPERYENPDWFWYQKDIQVETLYDVALEKGMTVAALLWPTTGRSKITYNMPEIFSNRKWTSQMMVSIYAGSPAYQLKMVKKHGHLRDGKLQPALDNFTTASTLETIHQFQPDMLLVHLTDLDSIRHLHGHSSVQAKEALHRHDERLTQLLDTLGQYAKYNHAYMVILGDHSSIDVTMGISINTKLKELGYLATKEGSDHELTHVKAFSKSCDGSCYIYWMDSTVDASTHPTTDPAMDPSASSASALKLERDLMNLANESSFMRFVSRQELMQKGADPQALCMLEAIPPYHFVEDILEEWITPVKDIPYYKGSTLTAVHGFDPESPNYQTVFYVKGPGVKPHVTLPHMSLVDIAPTLAGLLNWTFDDVDGNSYHQLLLEDTL